MAAIARTLDADEAQLKAWQQGKRPPGPLGLMPAVARRLGLSDIAVVAR